MTKSLSDKVVIVTGAGRGIGAAAAFELAERGARLILVARTESQLVESEKACASKTETMRIVADLAEEKAPRIIFDRSLEKFGRVDGLINNAGQFTGDPIGSVTTQSFDRDIAVNLKAPYFLCQEAFRTMKNGGAILSIGSVAGIRSSSKFPGSSVYAMTKFGIVGMTEVLALEGRAKSIQVNCIAPGAFETDMLRTFNSKIRTSSQPSDLAKVIAHTLELSLFAKLTGATLEVGTEMWVET